MLPSPLRLRTATGLASDSLLRGPPRSRPFAACLAAAALALAGCHARVGGERIVHVERSAYQTIVVADSATRRCLRFGESSEALNQSCQLLAQPDHLAFDYTRAMAAVLLLWQPGPREMLLIGIGGGSLPTALIGVRPDIEIDAVDIDAAVLRIAERYFGLRAGPRLRLQAADGRAYLAAARADGRRFDAIVLDAFDADGIPPAMFDEAFLRDARAALAPGGVFLANTFAASRSTARETAAAAQAFGVFIDVRTGDGGGNRLIVATDDPSHLPAPSTLLARLPGQQAALAGLGISEAWVRQLQFAAGAERSHPATAPARD